MTNNNLDVKHISPPHPAGCGCIRPAPDTDFQATEKTGICGRRENTSPPGDLLAAVDESAGNLYRQIEQHRALVAAALNTRLDPESLELIMANCPRRSREQRYKTAIQQTIEVLDASRRSFKSKQLEALRKHLTQVLIETK
jgi:hypothetical protein